MNPCPDETIGFDPRSGWLVIHGKRGCHLDDVLQPLTRDKLDRLAALAADMVSSELPMLEAQMDDGGSGAALFACWTEYPRLDRRRWGVTLARSTPLDMEGSTILSMSPPLSPAVIP